MGFRPVEVLMEKVAYIYPGQGSQAVGMGISAAESYDEAGALFNKASEVLGYDVRALCAEGPLEKLSQTHYTQPALFTVEAALTEVLKANGFSPALVAGHSLGEFSAWYAAGVYHFEDGLRLVAERGRLMDGADPEGAGSMTALIGLEYDTVKEICESFDGTVVVANINSPTQLVISGEKDAVGKAGAIADEKGARRVVPLKVSGAFHSPLMDGARAEFAEVVASIEFFDARIPVYSNVTARPVTDAGEIRKVIVEQVTSPVRWAETVMNIIDAGVGRAFEVGPGNVLGGLVKRTDKRLSVTSISDASSS